MRALGWRDLQLAWYPAVTSPLLCAKCRQDLLLLLFRHLERFRQRAERLALHPDRLESGFDGCIRRRNAVVGVPAPLMGDGFR